MVTRTWPVLQSFEKDQTRQNFVINQISGGLTELAALGGGGITQLTGDVTAGPGSGSVPATVATFGASGGSHARGFVPDPGATAGITKFLREDATWVVRRTQLTSATTFYVGGTGASDSNDGLSATVTGGHGPMATIQHAYDNICQNYDTGGQNVTIQIANGTYTTGLAVSNVWIGGSQIVINGNAGSPSSVIVSTTASCFRNVATLPAGIQIQNLTMTCSGAGNSCIDHAGTGTMGTGPGCIFGSSTLGHMLANGTGAIIFLNNAYAVTGGATYHWLVSGQGSISMAPFTVTISGSPAITYWALAQNCGVISTATAMVYSGAPAAGTQKYYSLQNAVIVSNGGPAYPGTVAGAIASGGIFV